LRQQRDAAPPRRLVADQVAVDGSANTVNEKLVSLSKIVLVLSIGTSRNIQRAQTLIHSKDLSLLRLKTTAIILATLPLGTQQTEIELSFASSRSLSFSAERSQKNCSVSAEWESRIPYNHNCYKSDSSLLSFLFS
jgi:hypothetical protein